MAHGRQEARLRFRRLLGLGLGRDQGVGLCTRFAHIHPVATPGHRTGFCGIRMGLAAHPARAFALGAQAELEDQRRELARGLFDGLQDVCAIVFLNAFQQRPGVLLGLLPADSEQRLQITGDEREAEHAIGVAACLVDHRRQVVGDLGQSLFQMTPTGHFAAQAPVADAMHQQRGQQHHQQWQAPVQCAFPVNAIAILHRQPVATQRLMLARRHLQQQAIEGGRQCGMPPLHRQHQLIVEARRCSDLQAAGETTAQQVVDHRQIAHVGIGLAIKQPLHRLFRTACRHDPGLRCLLQHVAPHTLGIGQQHALALQVRHAQQGWAVDAADDHVRHTDEGLAEHPIRPQVARIGRNSHHRLQLATAGLLAHLIPVVAALRLQVGAGLHQTAQVLTGQAAGLALLVGERQRRRVRCETDLQRLFQHPLLGPAQRHLRRCRPLRWRQPALHQGIALGLAGRSQGQIQRFCQRLLAVGYTEVQAFGRQIARPQQHHALQALGGDQFGGDIGIADIDISFVVSDHLECRQRAVCDKLTGLWKTRAHLRAGQEILLDHHPQSIQIGIVRGTQVVGAAHQGQRCLAIGGGIDHAAGAVGTQTDIHHHIDLATTCRIQHGGPIRKTTGLDLHTQLTGKKRQIIRTQTHLLAITE